MIYIYNADKTDFTGNGEKVLIPNLAKLHKEINGRLYIEIEATNDYSYYLNENNIIRVETPNDGIQTFRVHNINNNGRKIKCTARHVFYDTENMLVKQFKMKQATAKEILSKLFDSVVNPMKFSLNTNVQGLYDIAIETDTLYAALTKICDVCGAQIKVNNWDISIVSPIQYDNGRTIRYGKNIQNLTVTEDWNSVVTQLLPVGKDNIMLNFVNKSDKIYVYPSDETKYAIPYTKIVSFQQDIDVKDFTGDNEDIIQMKYRQALVRDLRKQAQDYVDTYCKPQINYTLTAFINWKVDIGEIIQVFDSRLNVDITTSVIQYDYNLLTNRYTSVQFGNYNKQLSSLQDIVTDDVIQKIQLMQYSEANYEN